MLKAMREAKVHTTWAAPDAAYEDAVLAFIRYALDTSRTNPFLESFASFAARFAPLGMRNSLVQAVLKLTVPGVPTSIKVRRFGISASSTRTIDGR